MNAANANVEQVAVAAFKTSGNLRNLSVVLNAQSSNNLMDQLSMLQQITRNQQKSIDDFKTAKSKVDDEKKQLDETIALYVARLLGVPTIVALANNKHPLVPLTTLRAGFRLVLHGLSTELLHALLVQAKLAQGGNSHP